ncbi:MAG: VOC family protein [Cyanothece sp. SIO1E1]|nr:VOC family protein [Cyanothece sp. SIO1E1]
MNPFKQHGAFSWCELMTTDTSAAKEFYSQLFGWSMRDEPMPEMIYTVVQTGDKEVGGIMPMPPDAKDMPPAWGTYVTVDDVDTTAKRVQELGGNVIVPPTDIPDVGRFCLFQDPQGAAMSIITYCNS